MFSRKCCATGLVLFTFLFFFIWILELDAFARVGGGRSFGSRGFRSYSSPSRSYTPSSPSRQSVAPSSPSRSMGSQPSMLRSFAYGALGGVLGSLLFSGLGHGAGLGGFGGSGFGFLEIIVIAVILYGIYRFFIKRRETASPGGVYSRQGTDPYTENRASAYAPDYPAQDDAGFDIHTGISQIRQMDPSFAEAKFTDSCMDLFFKTQGAWLNRDMSPARTILTDEMFSILQADAEKLKAEKKVNKLDNIAVRSIEITEVWQEEGMDFITVKFLASLLDYTVSETGELLYGSRTEPVKFEEYWTFTRPVGNNPWKLSAINQVQ